jgi:stringent starvation protein B
MLERDPKTLARLQSVVTALIELRVSTSLAEVDGALALWREGKLGALAAHGALLKHAARCERTVERVGAAAGDRPEGILRDAVDAGILDEPSFVELVGNPSKEILPAGSMSDDDEPDAPDKRKAVESLLERGPILIHVDSRHHGVDVPGRLRGNPRLVLRFGYGLTPAIPDLSVAEDSLTGTLTFGGVPYTCNVPWSAVYAVMVEGEQRGTVWPEDVPEDVLLAPPEEDGVSAKGGASGAGGAGDVGSGEGDEAREGSRPKRGGHLKLVD